MAAVSTSKYAPIWNRLKADRKVSVAIPSPLHRRLIKAVIKRKNEDLGYKYLLGEQGKKAILEYTIHEQVITFKLTLWMGNGIREL